MSINFYLVYNEQLYSSPHNAIIQEGCRDISLEVLTPFIKHLKTHRSQATIRMSRSVNTRFVNFLQITYPDLTSFDLVLTQHIHEFVNRFESPSYRYSVLYHLRLLFDFIGFEGKANPARKVRSPKVNPTEGGRKFLSKDDIALLIHELDRRESKGESYREIAFIYLLLFSGLRAGEALALKKENLRNHGRLVVKSSKTYTTRMITVSEIALSRIRKYHQKFPSKNPYLFYPRRNIQKPLAYSTLWGEIRSIFNEAGVKAKGKALHSLRHTFARAFMEQDGADITVLKALLGHSRIETTLLYRQLFDGDILRRGAEIEQSMLSYIRNQEEEGTK